jgi:hypothetical protein
MSPWRGSPPRSSRNSRNRGTRGVPGVRLRRDLDRDGRSGRHDAGAVHGPVAEPVGPDEARGRDVVDVRPGDRDRPALSVVAPSSKTASVPPRGSTSFASTSMSDAASSVVDAASSSGLRRGCGDVPRPTLRGEVGVTRHIACAHVERMRAVVQAAAARWARARRIRNDASRAVPDVVGAKDCASHCVWVVSQPLFPAPPSRFEYSGAPSAADASPSIMTSDNSTATHPCGLPPCLTLWRAGRVCATGW